VETIEKIDLHTITTDCKALNWIIARAKVNDWCDLGSMSFRGVIPFRMAQELKEYAKSINARHWDGKRAGYSWRVTEYVSISFTYGTTNSTCNDIQLGITPDYPE
jgi:hypothetical protein